MLLAVASLLALSGCTVTTPHLGGSMTVTAYFSSSSGVFVGNDVGVLGVPVGKITGIQPDGDRVTVTMRVDSDQPIPAGAAAVVVPRSVATDRYVELTPVYRRGPKMHSGAVIPLDRTKVPVEFDEVLGSLSRLARDLAGSGPTRHAVQRFLDSGSRTLKGKGALINHTVQALADASNGVSAQRRNGTATLVALDHLTGKLAKNQHTVRAFIHQVDRAGSLLAAERGSFREALHSTTRMIRVVARFARRNHDQIARAVRQTNGVMRTVLDKRKQAAEILRVTPLAMQNLMRTMTPEHTIRTRLNFVALLPVLGPLLVRLCDKQSIGPVCNRIGLDPLGLLDRLSSLFGGGGRR
ncbi:MAG: MCE family protein [Marmoricola sp.]